MPNNAKTATCVLAILWSANASALTPVDYGEQALGPQKRVTALQALGPDMFGEEINTYTGGVSFAQTDLAIPGNNSLSVAIGRRLVVDGNKSLASLADDSLWRGYSFGEWELDLPYMAGTYSTAQGWTVSTATPGARCSSPTTRAQFEPWDVDVGYVHFYNFSFWSGIDLNVPGQGEQKLLFRPPGGGYPHAHHGQLDIFDHEIKLAFLLPAYPAERTVGGGIHGFVAGRNQVFLRLDGGLSGA